MCLLLGLSVGAAAWMGQKRRQPGVVLGEVTQHGVLRYALPVGWEVDTKGLPTELLAEELRPHGRLLRVLVERKHGRSTGAEGLIARRSGGPQPGEPITMLGEEGLLVEAAFRTRPPGGGKAPGGDEEEDQDSIAQFGTVMQGLVAAVVLDDGLGVTVSLEGEAAAGPTNRKLIMQVIATMQRVPTTQPATRAASQKQSL
jgi:hypothetical protein